MISLYHATAAAFLAFSTLPPESTAGAPVIESPPRVEVVASDETGGLRIPPRRAMQGDAQD